MERLQKALYKEDEEKLGSLKYNKCRYTEIVEDTPQVTAWHTPPGIETLYRK